MYTYTYIYICIHVTRPIWILCLGDRLNKGSHAAAEGREGGSKISRVPARIGSASQSCGIDSISTLPGWIRDFITVEPVQWYVYVYMYICMCLYVCVACIYIYVHTTTYLYVYIYICMSICTYIYKYLYMYIYVHVYMYSYVHILTKQGPSDKIQVHDAFQCYDLGHP